MDDFKFETFLDAQDSAFAEYVSSVVVKLQETNADYREVKDEISSICEKYPAVSDAVDLEKPSRLTEQECRALIEIMELQERRHDMELEAIYLRGCYDSVGYLKKAGIL